MAYTDNTLNQLIVNKVTGEQYAQMVADGTINENELYVMEANEDYVSKTQIQEMIDDNDSNVVHKTGDETIGGKKTFTSNQTYALTNMAHIYKDTESDINVVPTTTKHPLRFGAYDKNNNAFGWLQTIQNTNGSVFSEFVVNNKTSQGEDVSCYLRLVAQNDGYTFARAPTPASDANSDIIATTAWTNNKISASANTLTASINTKANDSNVVHLTGDETITGKKTINEKLFLGPTPGNTEGGEIQLTPGSNASNGINLDTTNNAFRIFGTPTVGSVLQYNPQTASLTIGGKEMATQAWVKSLFSSTGTIGNGYYKFPDGFTIQWGTVKGTSTKTEFSFPISFATAAVIIVGGDASDNYFSGSSAQGINSLIVKDKSSFYARYGAGSQTGNINYVALGY